MEDKELVQLLEDVAKGIKTPAEAALAIGKDMGKKIITVVKPTSSGGGCQY